MKNYTAIEYLNSSILSIHTELLRIYGGSEHREDLQLDIKENGIIIPLIVSTRTSIHNIVSGGCRLRAAIALNIKSIPVICYNFPNIEAEKHFILCANRNRPKTKYQQLLEGREWELIEKKAAALRRKKGLEQRWKNKSIDDFDSHDYYPPTLLSDYRFCSHEQNQSKKNLRTIDRVGAQIGISAASYQRAKPVIEKCEKLRGEGKKLEAAVLEEYLEYSGINAAAKLVRLFDCDTVLAMVASGEAKTVSIALINIARISKINVIKSGAIFFFPDNKLRKPSYFHLGRVLNIANQIVTVCFRDSIDNDLYEHQYKCDELLCLRKEEEDWEQQSLRNRMQYLLSHTNTTPTDRYLLNRLLKPVISIDSEIEYLQIIEWRVVGVCEFVGVAA